MFFSDLGVKLKEVAAWAAGVFAVADVGDKRIARQAHRRGSILPKPCNVPPAAGLTLNRLYKRSARVIFDDSMM